MEIKFKAETHKYESISDPEKKWISTTSLVGLFKPKFDADKQSVKSSKNKKSKWYGMSPEEIREAWANESNRATSLGSWYHDQREKELLMYETIKREGIDLPIIHPIEQDGIKLSPSQTLTPGIYPEHLVYLKSAKLCGQADLVEIVNGYINITDYKTNKEIKTKGFTNWEGITNKMFRPVNHLDDCNLNHYNLQLSIYAYIIKKHNPKLKVGKLNIQHVKFKQVGTDKNGYPINEHVNGEPVLDTVKMYELPYLKDEVRSLIMWLKEKQK